MSLLGLCWSAAGRAEVHVLVVLAEAAAALLEGVDVAQLHSHSPLARPERLQPAPKAVRCDGSGTCRGTVSDPGGAIAEDEVELVLSDVSVELLELVDRSQSGHVTSAFGLAPRMLRQAEEAGQLPRHVVDAEGDNVDHVVGLLTQFLLGLGQTRVVLPLQVLRSGLEGCHKDRPLPLHALSLLLRLRQRLPELRL